jgi:CDP-glucose 4,6-dehydratase
MFSDIYKGKRVLVTGHTGFKGTWLTTWLLSLGAEVIGISKDIPTQPAMFDILRLKNKIQHHLIDVRNFDHLSQVIKSKKPDFVFHLAAQAIVSTSYSEPVDTISSNVMGTTNVLEALRISNHKCTAIIITSDKAYDNIEQIWGYKENDPMGGKDIYSGSKGAAELVIKSYYHSFFKSEESNVRLAIARAGNVIGGGDWAQDRIVVDCVEAWSKGKSVEVRSPGATRPWQHVLEPLSGYLNLGQALHGDINLNGEGFNFGPRAEQNHTVVELLKDLSGYWSFKSASNAFTVTDSIPFHEAGLLKLNCDKALSLLKWQAALQYEDTIKFTSEWYYNYYYGNNVDMLQQTICQINEYGSISKSKLLKWTA